MVDHLVAAIAIAAVGVLAQASALVLAAASGDAVTPWVSGGGAAAAVGGLVYMAKKLMAGELVALNTAQMIEKAGERDQRFADLVTRVLEVERDGREREDAHRALLLAHGGGNR